MSRSAGAARWRACAPSGRSRGGRARRWPASRCGAARESTPRARSAAGSGRPDPRAAPTRVVRASRAPRARRRGRSRRARSRRRAGRRAAARAARPRGSRQSAEPRHRAAAPWLRARAARPFLRRTHTDARAPRCARGPACARCTRGARCGSRSGRCKKTWQDKAPTRTGKEFLPAAIPKGRCTSSPNIGWLSMVFFF